MDIPTPPFADVSLARFKIEEVLPLNDPLTVPLLRLMIATNEVLHLQKLLVTVRDVDEASTESDKWIHEGEVGHLFRLLCGYLYEAMRPFRAVDQTDDDRLDKAAAVDQQGLEALAALRYAYDPQRTQEIKDSFLYLVRHKIAFHYDDQELRASFERHGQGGSEGVLVIAQGYVPSRFCLTDMLITLVIADGMKENPQKFAENYMRWIGEAIDLAGQLAIAVDHLLAYLLGPHKDRIEIRADRVTIHPAVRAATDKVEEERRRAREHDKSQEESR